MIDKIDPEIQRYLGEEFQKQKEKITERIIWRNLTKPYFIGPTPEDVRYATELSEEEIRKIAEKCCRELGYTSGSKKEYQSVFGETQEEETEESSKVVANVESDTIDKKDPEIKKCLAEELKKQKERIAERLIWQDVGKSYLVGESNKDIAYCTDLSEEEVEKLDKKCRWKLQYKDHYEKERLVAKTERFRQMLKNETSDDAIKAEFGDTTMDSGILKAWRKNPDKYAVMELASRVPEKWHILEGLHIGEYEFETLYPTDEELNAYHPIFKKEEVSDEELEKAYQKEERE
jgi:hypothetical protein